jgi:BirA family biotin operon repressor/biotin-[acetyl-CoA-carboxylase] ligase
MQAIRNTLGVYADRVRAEIYESLESTNTLAKSRPDEDCPCLIIAREQTGGRGRLGRSFHSPARTGLYMTVAYTTEKPLSEAVRVTCAAAVATVAAIEALTDKRPSIKWVNDIYLNSCKVGGILTEAITRSDGLHRMVVGIGLNLTTTEFPEGLRAPAASLFSEEEAAALPSDFADTLAAEITRRLLELVEISPACPFTEGMNGAACLDFYRCRLLYVGEPVVCSRGSERLEGTVRGVDNEYSLLLDVGDRLLTLSSGEISMRPLKKI